MKMKTSLLAACFFLICMAELAAQTVEKKILKAGEDASEAMMESIYRFEEFKTGKVNLTNGKSTFVKLNYNFLVEEMQFIDRSGDTLSLADPAAVKKITVGDHSFFYNKGFLELIEDYHPVKLAIKQRIRVVNREQVGAYGQASGASSVMSYNNMTEGVQTLDLKLNENLTLAKEASYYIIDKKNRSYVASKKGIQKVFPKQKSEIEKYLKENRVDFGKEEDMKKLIAYCIELSR